MTYQVLGKWPETLWKQLKLSTELSDEYLFLMRDGVLARKRNLEAVREHEEAAAERALIEANTARLRSQSCTSPGWPLSKRTAFGTLCWWLWVPHILGIHSWPNNKTNFRESMLPEWSLQQPPVGRAPTAGTSLLFPSQSLPIIARAISTSSTRMTG